MFFREIYLTCNPNFFFWQKNQNRNTASTNPTFFMFEICVLPDSMHCENFRTSLRGKFKKITTKPNTQSKNIKCLNIKFCLGIFTVIQDNTP